jgi:hypothetical protein
MCLTTNGTRRASLLRLINRLRNKETGHYRAQQSKQLTPLIPAPNHLLSNKAATSLHQQYLKVREHHPALQDLNPHHQRLQSLRTRPGYPSRLWMKRKRKRKAVAASSCDILLPSPLGFFTYYGLTAAFLLCWCSGVRWAIPFVWSSRSSHGLIAYSGLLI